MLLSLKKIVTASCLGFIIFSNCGYAATPTFSIKNNEPVKLSTLIHTMARQSGMDSTVNPKIDNEVLVTFSNKNINEAMDILSDMYSFSWYIKGNVIVVSTQEDMTTRNQRFPLRYANPDLVKNEIKSFIDESKISINPEDSTIAVDTTLVNLKKVAEKIEQLDKAPQQILIKAQIIEVIDKESRNLGLSHTWGKYNNLSSNKNIQYAVTANAEEILNKGKLVAAPSIMTINGNKAILEMGAKYPILKKQTNSDGNTTADTTIQYEDIGYFLTATPRVNNIGQENEFVTMNIEAHASTITGWVENETTKAPEMSNRTAKTNVRVKDGETIIIGGLIKDDELKTISKIPGLGDLPLIGHFFRNVTRNKEKSEIFIMITPHIVHADEENEVGE